MLKEPQVHFGAEDGRVQIGLRGEIDLLAQPLLDEAYSRLGSHPPGDLVVDLTEVTFLASNGLGFLARAHSHLGARGHTVTLHGPDRAVLRALELIGFDKMFIVTQAQTPSRSSTPPT